MVLNYIGSKKTLAPLIVDTIKLKWTDHKDWSFFDVFAGTGEMLWCAAGEFDQLYANDWETYSYLILKARFSPESSFLPDAPDAIDGHITREYSPPARMFFTFENARIIDGWREYLKITPNPDYPLACLLVSADRVANTTSVYGAYLKQFKNSAQRNLVVTRIEKCSKPARVTQMDASLAVCTVPTKTILYLDPPYNHRQYGANYFPLNVISNLKEDPVLQGVTGIPVSGYLKSEWCSKKTALSALRRIISTTPALRVVMSYNNEGIINQQDITGVFRELGWAVELTGIQYKRYKAGKNDAQDEVVEYLFMASKDFLGEY
jgi:adenine-specific DNA-methyltransferase